MQQVGPQSNPAAAIATQGTAQVTLAEPNGAETNCYQSETTPQKWSIERNRSMIVEFDAAVHFQPGVVEPTKASRIDHHQHTVDAWIEPGWLPVPEKEAAGDKHDHGQHEDEDRPARPLPDG